MTAEEELLDLNRRLAEAERRRDTSALAELLAADYRGIDASGHILTRESVLARFASEDVRIEELATWEANATLLGEVGVVTGRSRIRGTYRGEAFAFEARYTDVYRLRDGRWAVFRSQVTPIVEEE